MISDTILHKYMRHLRYIDQGSIVHLDAVELALRLALDELEQSIPSTTSTPSTELVALQANQLADLQAELERLQTAANAEVAELRQQIAQMDADNAAMIRRNRELVACSAAHLTGLFGRTPDGRRCTQGGLVPVRSRAGKRGGEQSMKAHPDGTAAAAWLVIILMVMGIATVVGSAVWLLVTHC